MKTSKARIQAISDYYKRRRATDPEWHEEKKRKAREYAARMRADPVWYAAKKKKLNEYRRKLTAEGRPYKSPHWRNSEAGKKWQKEYREGRKKSGVASVVLRSHRADIKSQLFKKYGGKCIDCGHSKLTSLHMDHVTGGDRKRWDRPYRPRVGGHHVYLKMLREPKTVRLQLRCANCNLRKAFERGEIRKDPRGRELRAEALKLYGSKCVKCGERDEIVLCFDHTNGGGTKSRHKEPQRHVGRRMHAHLIKERSTDRRLLCANCNYDAHFGQPIVKK